MRMIQNPELLIAYAIGIVIIVAFTWGMVRQLYKRINLINEQSLTIKTGQEHHLQFQQQQWQQFHHQLLALQGDNRQHVQEILTHQLQQVQQQMDKLTQSTFQQLQLISGQVDKRLNEGFDKTNQTFTDIVKRLALIDEAQKKITDLSSHVIQLQTLLSDKRARGAFGEMQLANLIEDMLSKNQYAFQYTLTNGKRADCMLFLPEPTGKVAIDAKFPLENYQRMYDPELAESEKQKARQEFRLNVLKHIHDIADRYIVPNETADGAILFIPAEAIFAEIHSQFIDIIEISHQKRVWLASPSTMMAILTTAKAVLKDEATRAQVHIIQEHLRVLAKDFDRFQQRMHHLAKHINQANEDVQEVNTSARKITARFQKIEQVQIPTGEVELALEESEI